MATGYKVEQMKWIKGEMFTKHANRPVRFSEPFKSGMGGPVRMVTFNHQLAWMVNGETGMALSHEDNEGVDDIIHRPPVPAPAACEHEWNDAYGGKLCVKCGDRKYRLVEADPANAVTFSNSPSPSPAPDSVEVAREIIKDGYYTPQLLKFLNAYIAEQSAQRKAAGELQAQMLEFIGASKASGVHLETLKALAADARCRAGKDGGK